MGCKFERVRAINGYDTSNDENAKKITFPTGLFDW